MVIIVINFLKLSFVRGDSTFIFLVRLLVKFNDSDPIFFFSKKKEIYITFIFLEPYIYIYIHFKVSLLLMNKLLNNY